MNICSPVILEVLKNILKYELSWLVDSKYNLQMYIKTLFYKYIL